MEYFNEPLMGSQYCSVKRLNFFHLTARLLQVLNTRDFCVCTTTHVHKNNPPPQQSTSHKMILLFRVKTRITLAASTILAVLYFLLISGNFPHPDVEETYIKPIVGQYEVKESHQFWNQLFDILQKNKLDMNPAELKQAITYNPEESQIKSDVKTKEVLLSKAEISPAFLKSLKQTHTNIRSELPKKFHSSTFKMGLYGVVVVGGGKFSWLAHLSILALRDTGSTVPVEVVMPSYADYESDIQFCRSILPALNAACVLVPDVLGPTVMQEWSTKFSTYQFKSLALIVSSFQHILLLDSDNIIMSNPEDVWESELYKSTGMITWPDYWTRTILPHFYDIAGVKVAETRVRKSKFPLKKQPGDNGSSEPPFHDLEGAIPDMSTESGQLFINRDTHASTLLLSLYYNVYGPNIYYRLLSLGEPGEGDKETFVTAAEFTKEPYYQLKSFIQTFGYHDSESKYNGVAMGQRNPILDHERYLEMVINNKELSGKGIDEQIELLDKIEQGSFSADNDIPMFSMHCNFPKLDPIMLFASERHFDEEKNRLKYRMFGGLKYKRNIKEVSGKITSTPVDFELQIWKNIHNTLCVKKLAFDHFKRAKMDEMCVALKNEVDWLVETTVV